jgi:hypothetical protein
MNTRRTLCRIASAVSAAAVLTIAFGAPAQATVAGAAANSCNGLHCYSAVATVDIQPVGNGMVQVAWSCQATGTPDAASTSITLCSVGSIQAPPVTMPGAYAATAWSSTWPSGVTLPVCVAGYSTFVESVTGAMTVGASSCGRVTLPTVNVQHGGIV